VDLSKLLEQRSSVDLERTKRSIILDRITRSSAIAGRPCDAKACQGLLKWTWK